MSPLYLVAAAAAGDSDGAGAAVAATAGAAASVSVWLVVWLFVLVPVVPDWPCFVLTCTCLGLFGLICLYQIQS